MKLKIDDIRIRHDGEQLKNAVLSKYPTVDSFLEVNKIPMYKSSIVKYFRSRKVSSQRFKYWLVKSLDMDYHDIVLTPEQQIERFVDNAGNDIFNYLEDEDLKTLEEIKKLCIKYRMRIATAKMYRSIGLYRYYHDNNATAALEMIKTALNMISDIGSAPLLYIKFYSDYGIICYYSMDYKMARDAFSCVDILLEQTKSADAELLFQHYYSFGNLEIARHKYDSARGMFGKAMKYAADEVDKGKCIMNTGLTYKLQQSYEAAMGYYEEALDYLKDTSSQSVIYNNIADLYMSQKDYTNAMLYINMAFDSPNSNIHNYMACFDTYVQILSLKKETPEAWGKFLEIIEQSDNSPITNRYIIKSIDNLIDYGYKCDELMEKLRTLILGLITKHMKRNKSYSDALFCCLGKLGYYTHTPTNSTKA